MYNPAKISSKRTTPEDLNIQYTVSVINIAMHYIYLQRICLNILHIKKKSENKNFNIFFNIYRF